MNNFVTAKKLINMNSKILVLTLCLSILFSGFSKAATFSSDSISNAATDYDDCKFKATDLIAPAVLVTVGSIGVKNEGFKRFNSKIRNKMSYEALGTKKTYADDYIQYLPIASVYGLSLLGAKAKHDYIDRTMVLVVSAATMAAMVNTIKYTVKEQRPHNPEVRNSFPSGHTATAFMGAEIVREEYGWGYGAAAYGISTLIGVARIYNDRHWFNDILAGAGIGILSARIGYWLLPYTSRIFKKNRNNMQIGMSAFATGEGGCASVALTF